LLTPSAGTGAGTTIVVLAKSHAAGAAVELELLEALLEQAGVAAATKATAKILLKGAAKLAAKLAGRPAEGIGRARSGAFSILPTPVSLPKMAPCGAVNES
jgi:hypothetical protein